MRRSVLFALTITVVTGLALLRSIYAQESSSDSAPDLHGRLTLRNGDYLSGTFTASETEKTVSWSSPSFLDPLEFSYDSVELIEFGSRPKPMPQAVNQDPVRRLNPAAGIIELIRSIPRPAQPVQVIRPQGARLALHGNSVLYGRLVDWTDDSVTIESKRHDRAVIHRSWIRELEGINEKSTLLFEGSGQLNRWKSIGEDPRSIDEWTQSGNELITSVKGANLYFDAGDGGPWSLEVTLAGDGTKIPEFQIALGASGSLQELMKAYCIDNWGNQLVAYREGDGEIQLVQLRGTELAAKRPITLLLYFDPGKQELTAYSDGTRLGQLVIPGKVEPAGKGLLIRNRGKELRVLAARLRRWNGEINDVSPTDEQDRVFGIEGQRWSGKIVRVDIPNNKLILDSEGNEQELTWAEIDRIQLGGAQPAPSVDANPANSVLVHYADGEALQGQYRGATADGLMVQIPQSPSPILCRSLEMRRIQFVTPESTVPAMTETPQQATALVEGFNHRLHGRIVNAKTESQLAWLAFGANKPARFASSTGTKVSFEPTGYTLDSASANAILTLTTGESIPCEIHALNGESIEFKLPGGHSTSVPSERIKAVRFQAKESWIYEGLRADDRWLTLSKDGLKWRDETLTFFRPSLIARELPLTSRVSIEFDLKFHNESAMNFIVGLGADVAEHGLRRPQDYMANEETLRQAAKERPDYVAEAILTRNRRSLTARGLSRAAGVMGLMFQGNPFQQQEQMTALPLSDAATAHIELQVDPQQREYIIRGNGQILHRWRDSTPLSGEYFYLGVTNESDSVIHGATTSPSPLVSVHNLRIRRWTGEMAEDDRERFLTRRVGASPKAVTHVLRAINGDNLRGRLLGISKDHVEFQSRLDPLSIPRSKVAEIIWIAGEKEAKSSPDQTNEPKERSAIPPQTNVETPVDPVAATKDRGEGRVVLRSGESIVLRGLQATDTMLTGVSFAGPMALQWPEISEIHFGSLDVPQPPYGEWVQRDPPPLPEMPASAGEQPPSPLLDKPAPDFELEMLDGEKVTSAKLRGRIVILDFWATWCGPCLNSLPVLMEIASERQQDVTLIAVNQQEDPEELRAFLATHLWTLDVGLDRDGQLGQVFGASAIPLTVILDQEGVVRHVHVGSTPDLKQELLKTIDRLTGNRPATP